MASKFNIVAELQLRGPKNLNQITKQIRSKLGNINANVNIKLSKQAAQNIKQLAVSLNKIAAAAKQASASSKNATSSINNMGNSAQKSSAQLQNAATGAAAFGKQSALAVKRFAAFSIGAGIMMGVANAIREGTKAAVDFERQMVKISQVTGKTMSNLKSLSSEIGNLSSSLGVSSAEMVDVARTLSQTGLAARDVTIAMKALAQSSLAPTFKDMANTAEGAIAIMRQFGVTADQLSGKLGSINALAGQFAVESQDLIFAIRRTGGAFQAAGGNLEELLALFTSVRATTRESAETIATGFRTIFTRMQRPKTIEFLRQSGIELQNLEGNFVGPFEAVKRLNAALKSLDSTDPRFAKIVEELGGFRQVSKVIPLIQQFATAQNALRVAQQGQGSLAKDAATAQQALAVQIVKVREEFLALFRDLAGSSTFKAFAGVALSMASSLIKVADAIKPILPLLGALAAFQGARMGFQFLGGFMGGLGGSGARGVGQNLGAGAGGANSQVQSQSMSKLTAALATNTTSLTRLTAAVTALSSTLTRTAMASSLGRPTMRGGRPTFGPGFNTGGIVPGTGHRDTVPAMLTPGEFVIRKSSVKKYGSANLQKMNLGGRVPASSTVTPGGTLLFNNPSRLQLGSLRGARASQLSAAQAQGRSKDMQILQTDKKTKVASGKNQLQAAFGAAETRALGMADTDSYGGAFMVTPGTSESFLGTNRAFGPLIKKTKGYQTYLQRKKLLSPELKALAETKEQGILEKYRTKNKYAMHAGALLPGVSEKVEDTLLNGVNRTVNRAARNINAEAGARTDASAIVAAMKSANIDQTMGNLFENVLMAAGTPFSPKDADAANASFDFPKGLGARKKSFAMPGAKGNIPVDAKTRFTRPNMRSLISKVENFNTKEAERELDLVFQGMASQIPVGKASGGGISGSDTVPALLTPGEFVVNKSSAQRIGIANLNAVNKGKVQGFASGGVVQKFNKGGQAGGGGMGGQIGMGLMMIPMASQMVADSFGGLGESGQKLLDTFNTVFMSLSMLVMLGPMLQTPMMALVKHMVLAGGATKALVASFMTASAPLLATVAAVAAVGLIVKVLGDNMKDAALKAGESAKSESDEKQAREDFQKGSTVSNAGTGALIGTLVGALGGPLGMIIGGAVGAVIGSMMGPDLSAIESAIQKGRAVRFQKQMSDSLKSIEKNGISFTNVNALANAFASRGKQVNAADKGVRQQASTDFQKNLPQIRGVLDRIAATSSSFAEFEDALGGGAGRILETIKSIDPALWQRLKDEIDEQIIINEKLKESKKAEIAAAKEMKNLVRELQNFSSGLKDTAAIFNATAKSMGDFNSSISGKAKAQVGPDASVIGRASAGEQVSSSQLKEAIDSASPNEEIAAEGFKTAQLMSKLPDILSQAAKESQGDPDKFQKVFAEVAKTMGFTGKAIEALSTKLGSMAGGRSKSEGGIVSEIQEDSAAFAEKLQTDSMKALLTGIQDAAKAQQAMFDSILNVNQQILETERKIAKVRIKTLAKEAQLTKAKNRHSGKTSGLTEAQARGQFMQRQRIILGPDDAGAAGDVGQLEAGLLQAQGEIRDTQAKLSNAQDLSAKELEKLAQKLSDASDRADRFKKALEDTANSTEELTATQEALAVANKKRDFLQNAAFMKASDQQQLSDNAVAGNQLVFNPTQAATQFDKFGDTSAEFFQGGLAYLQSLQAMGITTLKDSEGNDVNIQDSLDEFTIERLGQQSGLQGQELADFKANLKKQMDERRALQEREKALLERQVQAMEALTLALEVQRMNEEAEKEKDKKIRRGEANIKHKEDELEAQEADVQQKREDKANIDAEIKDRQTLGTIGEESLTTPQLDRVKDSGDDLQNIIDAETATENAAKAKDSQDSLLSRTGLTGVRNEIDTASKNTGDRQGRGANRVLTPQGIQNAATKLRQILAEKFADAGVNQSDMDAAMGVFLDSMNDDPYLGNISKSIKKAVKKLRRLVENRKADAVGKADASRDNLGTESSQGANDALTPSQIDNMTEGADDAGEITGAAGRQSGRRGEGGGTDSSSGLMRDSGQLTNEITAGEENITESRDEIADDREDLSDTKSKPAKPRLDSNIAVPEDQASLNLGQSQMVCPVGAPYMDDDFDCTGGNAAYFNQIPGAEQNWQGAELVKKRAMDFDQNKRTLKYDDEQDAAGWNGKDMKALEGTHTPVPYYSSGGPFGAGNGAPAGSLSKGTDTRLAALTPGEFVVNRMSSAKNIGLLHAINNSNVSFASKGGSIGYFQDGTGSGGGVFSALSSAVQLLTGAISEINMSGQGGASGSTDFGALTSALTNFPKSDGVTGLTSALNRFSDTFGANSIEVKMESNGVDVNLNGVESFANLAESSLMSKVAEIVTARFNDLFQGQDS